MPCPTSSPTISSPTIQETLTYNKANQRATQAVSDIALFNKPGGSANQVTTATYGGANSLNQYPTAAGATLQYDANGNLTFDGINTFTYDAENRLLTASNAQHTSSYTYDGLGRRRTKTVDSINTAFADAGDQEMLEFSAGTGQILRHFVYADGIDEPLDMMTPSTVASPANDTHRYTVPDPGGSILALVDPTQTGAAALVSQYGYRPFGESTDSTGAYRFTSRRLDAETGLYYYRARMYSPTLGRFLQPDPIGIKGGSNLYAYVGNDPLNNTDPSGLINVFVGGAGDSTINGNVLNYQRDVFPGNGQATYYFNKDQRNEITNLIQSQPSSEPINVITHSLGANVGAIAIANAGRPVDLLITIEPEGQEKPGNFQQYVSSWINVTAGMPGSAFGVGNGNLFHFLGNPGGNLNAGANATSNYSVAGANHADFQMMMQAPGPTGASAEGILSNRANISPNPRLNEGAGGK